MTPDHDGHSVRIGIGSSKPRSYSHVSTAFGLVGRGPIRNALFCASWEIGASYTYAVPAPAMCAVLSVGADDTRTTASGRRATSGGSA